MKVVDQFFHGVTHATHGPARAAPSIFGTAQKGICIEGHIAELHGDAGWVAGSDAWHPRRQGVPEKSLLSVLGEHCAMIWRSLPGRARSGEEATESAPPLPCLDNRALGSQAALRIIESAQSKAQLKEIEARETARTEFACRVL